MGTGDADQMAVAKAMERRMAEKPYSLVLLLGDNIYGDVGLRRYIGIKGGDKALFEHKFDQAYANIRKQTVDGEPVQFRAALGNHDIETRNGLDEVNDPTRFGITGKEGYYTFESPARYKAGAQPLVEFFVLNSNLGSSPMAAQREWLGGELGRSQAVWRIALQHHPLYTPRSRHDPERVMRTR